MSTELGRRGEWKPTNIASKRNGCSFKAFRARMLRDILDELDVIRGQEEVKEAIQRLLNTIIQILARCKDCEGKEGPVWDRRRAALETM